jgi:hypothetical protein
MSLKNKLDSYTPLELKEFIKEHNKRARKMISEETKEFRKEQLSKLIIKAVGKKDDLIKKMVNVANTKDISSFKLIKEKGKMTQEKKNQLDEVQTKEAEQLAKDFKKGKIDEKELKKKLDEIKKERIRAELPKLNVSKLLKFIKEKPDKKDEEKKKDKPPQPKRKAPTLAEVRAKNLKEKREAMKPKREPPKRKEPIKPKGKAPAPPKKEEPKKEDTDTEDEEFVMPKFFKNTDPKIRENIEKAVKKGDLPESSIVLVTTYKTLKKIKTAVEKKDKDNEDRIDGLGRGLGSDSQDEEYYKAIFGKKYPKKEIEKEFLSVAKNMIGGEKATRDKVRKWIDKADVAIQKKLFNFNKEGYLLSVTGVNDKTGESRKEADRIDRAIAKQKADREKDFAKAKAEQAREEAQVAKQKKEIMKKK